MSEPETGTRGFISGFVSIVGRPNAGKSTLLNALAGQKLAIVADKPQTTRLAVQAIWNSSAAQIVFLDTPGIHRSDTLYNRQMMAEVRSGLSERDLLLYLADATKAFKPEDAMALDLIKKAETPTLLLLSKLDLVKDKKLLLPLIESYRDCLGFAEYLPVSALTGEGLDPLRDLLLKYLPEGPAYFPPEYVTDQPRQFLASELIREALLRNTRQEVPHGIAVVVDRFQEKRSLLHVLATIYVEREGQKAIIIGAGGAMLKRVGTQARLQMEAAFATKVLLELFVKVKSTWRENPEFLRQLDWRKMAGDGVD